MKFNFRGLDPQTLKFNVLLELHRQPNPQRERCIMSSMLAIARPNPMPKKKGSSKMLRKLSGRRNPLGGVVRGSSRRNPSSSAKSLRSRLAKARKNGVVRGSSRRNPSKSMSLRDRLAKARKNGVVRGSSRRNPRKNPSSALKEARTEIQDLKRKLRSAKATAKTSGKAVDRRMVSRLERQLNQQTSGLKAVAKKLRSLQSSLGGISRKVSAKPARKKASTKRKASTTKRKTSTKRKASTAKKATLGTLKMPRSYSGYSRMKSGNKRKFSMAFNAQFKKARRLGKSPKVAHNEAVKAGQKAVRSNPASVGSVLRASATRSNPKRKATKRKVTKRKTTRSKRSKSLSAQLPASKRALFNKKVKSETTRLKKKHKKASAKQIKVWAQLSAFSKVKAGRKNPHCATKAVPNPRKKKRTVSRKRKRTTSKRKLVRAKRIKPGMSASAKRVLSNYGSHHVTATIKGKQTVVRAGTNSKAYKGAKRRGLTGKFRGLKGKKNTPSSLNLNSVRKVFGGDYTKSQLQEALNIWTGAIDGGHVRGVSKSMIRKTRRNPKSRVRKHTISAISNPMPMSLGLMQQMEARSNAMTAMDYGYGAGAFALGLYGSNLMSSFISAPNLLNVDMNDINNKSANYIVSESLPLLLAGLASGTHLYKKFKGEAVDARTLSISTGVLAGSVLSVVGRTLAKGLGRLLGLAKVAEIPGDTLTFSESSDLSGYLVDNQMSPLGGLEETNMSRLYGNHVGRYVQTTPSTGRYVQTTGRYVQTAPSTGRYVQTTGRYVSTPAMSGYRRVNGEHLGAMHHGDVHHMGSYLRANPAGGVGANVSDTGIISAGDGNYNMDAQTLREDINLYEPLTPAEMQAEGLDHVSDTGEMYKVIRATPDVARQVVESNFGSLIGDSNVVRGAVLVLASIYDAPQNTLLTDRLRLDRAPELPKGASFGNAGGVFSRGIFNAIFPSIDNQPTFQEFGVRAGN